MISIIVHGGAGRVPEEIRAQRKPVLKESAEAGFQCLESENDALVAVEEAVKVLEDAPLFNAGTGSVLTIEGTVEMDAAIMDSEKQCGAVTELKNVKNPISVAKLVMEKTDHILLTGEGLKRFVSAYDIPEHDPVTDRRRKKWKKLLKDLEKEGYDVDSIPDPGEWGHCKSITRKIANRKQAMEKQGTVGAVAIDGDGKMAAATSTGGTAYKYPGRVGDTPIIGSGTFAAANGAVSATGDGETIMKSVIAKHAHNLLKDLPAEEAVEKTIEYANEENASCGLIAVDPEGGVGAAFNTDMMDTHSITG